MSSGYNCIFGLEIESAFKNLEVNIGEYHRGTTKNAFGEYFVAERDGSLKGTPTGNYNNTAEFVSKPFLFNDRIKVLDNFKETTQKPNLSDVFSFNTSTSCHINVSLIKKDMNGCIEIESGRGGICIENASFVKLPTFITHNILKTIRLRVFNEIKTKYNESEALTWFKNYNRPQYAPLNEEKLLYNHKYSELHIRPNNIRLEFRGFHIQGIRDWDRFKWYINMFLEVITETLIKEMKENIKFKEEENIEFKFNIKYKKLNFIEREL